MKKNIFIFSVLLALAFVFSAPSALAWTYGQPLVPCRDNCQLCDLWTLAKNLIDFIVIAVVPVVGTLLFILAGIYYLLGGANPGFVSKAKSLFKGTVMAIMIIMLAWLITNTLIVNLGSTGMHAWYQLNCTNPDFDSAFQPAVGFPNPPPVATPPPGGGGGGAFDTDAGARAYLAGLGITVNAPEPTTSLAGLQGATLGELAALRAACPSCVLVVTGGTEPGHSTLHTQGYKVDLRFGSVLDNYIMTNYLLFSSVPYPQYRAPDGTIYMRETDHWDVCVNNAACP